MRRVELGNAPKSLSRFASSAGKNPVVLTRRGKPVALLVGVTGVDLEDLALSSNPDFIALIERSRRLHAPGTGIPLSNVRRHLGLPPRPRKPKARRRR